MDLNQKRLQVLEDTVKYYSEDPVNRRCLGNKNKCFYSGKYAGKETTDGCAVGRLLPEELRLTLDKDFTLNSSASSSSVESVFGHLPENIKELGKRFLRDLQQLHDGSSFWGSEGLTEKGKDWYQHIQRSINSNNYNQ